MVPATAMQEEEEDEEEEPMGILRVALLYLRISAEAFNLLPTSARKCLGGFGSGDYRS